MIKTRRNEAQGNIEENEMKTRRQKERRMEGIHALTSFLPPSSRLQPVSPCTALSASMAAVQGHTYIAQNTL
jgi:hypothetical protein